MKLKNSFLVLGITIVSMLAANAVSADVEVGTLAPDFSLSDSTGANHSLSDHTGEIVVLEWINPECPFVRKHYDSNNMQGLQKTYTEQGITWFSIDSSAPGKQGYLSAEEANAWKKTQNGAQTAVLLDPNGEVGRLYGAKTTPHMYIVDAQGTLVYAWAIDDTSTANPGDIPTSTNYVVQALEEVKSGQLVSVPATRSYGCSVKY